MEDYRIEFDSVGQLEIPKDAYYGVQSLRGKNNFNITGRKMHPLIIQSLAEVKKACAITNIKTGALKEEVGNAIIEACDDIIEGKFHDQFIVDPIQGGAGTSANMNANEVIANIALEKMDNIKGNYVVVHPNDHVNLSQSTNDVFPTAGKITIIKLLKLLEVELNELYKDLMVKAIEFKDVIKMGRTQLEDAVPTTLGKEFQAYACGIKRDIKRLKYSIEEMESVNMGATAIGTGINASKSYIENIVIELDRVCDLNLKSSEDLVDGTQNLDCYTIVSGNLKALAVNLSKMANDLRLMNSGPRTGLSEIFLPAKQNGSSIMPGKINPVIPEVVNQISFNVIGNDMTIAMACEGGQLELNAFEPVIFYNLIESIETLTNGINTFRINAIKDLKANEENCRRHVNNSIGLITAANPYIGYEKSATIAKEALKTGVTVRSLLEHHKLLDEDKIDDILDPFHMLEPK